MELFLTAFVDELVKHADPLTAAALSLGGSAATAAIDQAIKHRLRERPSALELHGIPAAAALSAGISDGSPLTAIAAGAGAKAGGGVARLIGQAAGRAIHEERHPFRPYAGDIGAARGARPARIVGQLAGGALGAYLARRLRQHHQASVANRQRLDEMMAEHKVAAPTLDPPKALTDWVDRGNSASRALDFKAPPAPESKLGKLVKDVGSRSATGAARGLRRAAGMFDF